ncbi:hypothetical protein FC831_13710 [Clostridium botulinum]|nr:hypothetical protein [Clostridium botulinum]
MEIAREYIERLKQGKELDYLVNKYVFNGEKPIWKYSSDITQTKRIIEKYKENIVISYLTPMNSFGNSYEWHCNIEGFPSFGNDTMEEAICKSSLLHCIV